MSTKHYVTCTINNATSSEIQYTENQHLSHGEFNTGPNNITANTEMTAFKIGGTGGNHTAEGWVEYSLPDEAILGITCCNPNFHNNNGSESNQWAYPCTTSYSQYFAIIDSSSFLNPINPMTLDNIQPIVNVYALDQLNNTHFPSRNFGTPTGNYVQLMVVNNSGNPMSLAGLTSGIDSPTVSAGNAPFVASTIPTNTMVPGEFIALLAVGSNNGSDPTQGSITYNLSANNTLTFSWNAGNDLPATTRLNGTGTNQASLTTDEENPNIVILTIS